jgi:hypothetical protein
MIWLGAGIVLMGASVSVEAIVVGGPTILALVLGVVAGTTVFVELVARNVFDLRERLGSLLATGTGICGVSAVVAVARSIDADEESIAHAAGTVLLFDAVTLVAYPAIGTLLSVPDRVFGVWAGLSMFSTGPIVAAGFAYSETAGQWATITKLARNALIGAVVLACATYYARRGASADAGFRALWSEFPQVRVRVLPHGRRRESRGAVDRPSDCGRARLQLAIPGRLCRSRDGTAPSRLRRLRTPAHPRRIIRAGSRRIRHARGHVGSARVSVGPTAYRAPGDSCWVPRNINYLPCELVEMAHG